MGRPIERIDEFTNELNRIWKEHASDWRFFQLVSNLQSYCGSDLFYLEDDKALHLLKEYFGENNVE